jgi:hypothetical protein
MTFCRTHDAVRSTASHGDFMGNLLVVTAYARLTNGCAQPPFSSLLALTAA